MNSEIPENIEVEEGVETNLKTIPSQMTKEANIYDKNLSKDFFSGFLFFLKIIILGFLFFSLVFLKKFEILEDMEKS